MREVLSFFFALGIIAVFLLIVNHNDHQVYVIAGNLHDLMFIEIYLFLTF